MLQASGDTNLTSQGRAGGAVCSFPICALALMLYLRRTAERGENSLIYHLSYHLQHRDVAVVPITQTISICPDANVISPQRFFWNNLHRNRLYMRNEKCSDLSE